MIARVWLPRPEVPLAFPRPPHWTEQALCAQVDPELFFPEKGGSVAYAKKVCAACPVIAECLDYALEIDDRHGVWGGKSAEQRAAIKAASAGPPPPERRCMKGLHVLAGENLTGTGSCRACKKAAARARREQGTVAA